MKFWTKCSLFWFCPKISKKENFPCLFLGSSKHLSLIKSTLCPHYNIKLSIFKIEKSWISDLTDLKRSPNFYEIRQNRAMRVHQRKKNFAILREIFFVFLDKSVIWTPIRQRPQNSTIRIFWILICVKFWPSVQAELKRINVFFHRE